MPDHKRVQEERKQAQAKGREELKATAAVGPAAPFRGMGLDTHQTSHNQTRGADRVQQDRDLALRIVFKAVFLTVKEVLGVQLSSSSVWRTADIVATANTPSPQRFGALHTRAQGFST
jgi:hypothetical protein